MRIDGEKTVKLTKRRKRIVALQLAAHYLMAQIGNFPKPKWLDPKEWDAVEMEIMVIASTISRRHLRMSERCF